MFFLHGLAATGPLRWSLKNENRTPISHSVNLVDHLPGLRILLLIAIGFNFISKKEGQSHTEGNHYLKSNIGPSEVRVTSGAT